MRPRSRWTAEHSSSYEPTATSTDRRWVFCFQMKQHSRARQLRPWTREIGPTLKLAMPIMAGMVSHMLMGLVDTVMVGHIGVTPLAASSFVNLLLHPPITFGLGLLSAVAILTAQAYGARNPEQAGEALRNGLLASVGFGLLVAILAHLLVPYLDRFGQEPAVVRESGDYLLICGWSVIPALVAHAAKQFSEAINHPWMPNFILLAGVALNVFLNWILIFGNLGAPALGLAGAGWATLMARVVVAIAMLVYLARNIELRRYLPGQWLGALNISRLFQLLKLGGPVGTQHLLEVSAFAFAALMMGWISAEAIAAHQIAITCAATTFMFMVGLGMAVCIRVGHAFGAGKRKRTRRIGFVGILLAVGGMGLFGLMFITLRYPLARAFITDPEVVRLTAQFFIVAALFQIADGVQVTAMSALRGLSDVKIPAFVAIFAYWMISIPLGAVLAFRLNYGPIGIWIALAIGLGIAACALTWRFHHRTAPQKLRTTAQISVASVPAA
jgi:multidrug resistance protein, MATE family